jgi:uncharacterized ferredoxin-like protein
VLPTKRTSKADVAVRLSMSVTHKNIFFDKRVPEVKFSA